MKDIVYKQLDVANSVVTLYKDIEAVKSSHTYTLLVKTRKGRVVESRTFKRIEDAEHAFNWLITMTSERA